MSGIEITHPDKVMFPDDGITKGELAGYYELVAPHMLPHVSGRPITMQRFHRGIAEEGFFQKNVANGPDWLERVAVPKKDGLVNYPVIFHAQGLIWMANQNCITPHVWVSRVPDLSHPDLCVFDLDPSGDDDREPLRAAVLLLRDLLAELGCASWVKTSGSKGFHVVIPLDGSADSGRVSHFAHAVGASLVERDPTHLTQEFYKADRAGRILIDTGRNEFGATFAAPYSVRPRPTAPVSAPCTWDEVASGEIGPRSVTLRGMAERLDRVGELWSDLHARPVALPEL